MNLYYKCSEHCNANGADCKNGGYRLENYLKI